MRTFTDQMIIMSAKAADGIGNPLNVKDFIHLVLGLDLGTTPTLTVKFQGSVQDTMPNFAAAQSASNMWDYVEVKDLEDGSAIDGDTGIAAAGTTDHRLLEVNVNGLKWFCAIISGFSDGDVTLKATGFGND